MFDHFFKLAIGSFIQQWFEVFNKYTTSNVIQEENLFDTYPIHRGCRQGDLLSPYVFFNLCVNIGTSNTNREQ